MAKKHQMTLVADPDPDPEMDDTAETANLRLWSTAARLTYAAVEQLATSKRATSKQFTDSLSEATKELNAHLRSHPPSKGSAVKDWAERAHALQLASDKVIAEKDEALGALKSEAQTVGTAHHEVMKCNPTASQAALPFAGADGKAPPLGLSDETLGVVNSLARREIEAAHGNAPADIVALAAALANVQVANLTLGSNASEAIEAAEDGEDLSDAVEDEDGEDADEGEPDEADDGSVPF